jgi:hypothetical protein
MGSALPDVIRSTIDQSRLLDHLSHVLTDRQIDHTCRRRPSGTVKLLLPPRQRQAPPVGGMTWPTHWRGIVCDRNSDHNDVILICMHVPMTTGLREESGRHPGFRLYRPRAARLAQTSAFLVAAGVSETFLFSSFCH